MKYDRYVQVEAGLVRSKLIDRARSDLGVSTNEAIGLMVRLWIAALTARTRGQIGDRSDAWIEEECGWRGAEGVFARFVRAHHLDDAGVIRDWLEKYGKLDVDREKRADIKRRQRHRDDGQSSGQDDGQSSGQGTGLSQVRPVERDESSSSSSSLSVTQQSEQEKQRDQGRERGDPLAATLAEAKLDLTGFEETDRAVIEGALRASRAPLARATVIANALKEHSPLVVGRAFREYIASEQPWSSRLFGGFIRDAAKQVQVGENRVRTANETKHISSEEIEAERSRREEAEAIETIADFERTHGEEFERLKAQAETMVSSNFKGMFRAPMVRAALLKLIRERGAS